ncbi:unnamed protein product [marine sediment metagenome]|uniref:DUF4386 domain-containing protein n=1 Tax=marine sediment metagenome TaxID=412755 RepID=X1PS28_9ZZZZ
MTKEKVFDKDPSWKGVIKWGGLSLFVAGLVPIIFILSIFITQQTMPVPAKEALENPALPTNLFLLAAIGELLLLPAVLALYFSLKDVKKTPMFMATGLWLLAVPMFLASRGLIISLSQISARYMATTNATMKAAYLASAELALETQNIYATMGLIFLAVASIIIGLVMLKGVFGKRIGYLVIVASIWTIFTPFGVIFMSIPFIIPFMGVILTAVWQIIVGAKLYKLGKDV